jgi:hypothetical protein
MLLDMLPTDMFSARVKYTKGVITIRELITTTPIALGLEREKGMKSDLNLLFIWRNILISVLAYNASLRGKKLLAKISDEGAKSQLFFVLLSALLAVHYVSYCMPAILYKKYAKPENAKTPTTTMIVNVFDFVIESTSATSVCIRIRSRLSFDSFN